MGKTSFTDGQIEVIDTRDKNILVSAAAGSGNIANIDYEGRIGGELFDGGSASNYGLTLGSGTFIAGFESGLIGHTKGETVVLNLKFPESYYKEELAGKDVEFTVKINSVKGLASCQINLERPVYCSLR